VVSQSKKSEKDHKEVVYSISPLRKMNTNPVENVEYSKKTCPLMSTNGPIPSGKEGPFRKLTLPIPPLFLVRELPIFFIPMIH